MSPTRGNPVGQHQGLPVHDHAEVADQRLVEDGVDGLPVVAGALRVAVQLDPRARRSGALAIAHL